MSQIDPTDHALAAIASILEQPETRKEPETGATASPPPLPTPPPLPESAIMAEPEAAAEHEATVQPEATIQPEALAEQQSAAEPEAAAEPVAVADESPLAPAVVDTAEAAGYSKLGPGPIAAIRFKWTVRRDDGGQFYVDETIGENSTPIVIGPLSADDAIRTVDECESDARRRFEQLRDEMTGRAAAANLVRNDGGEM